MITLGEYKTWAGNTVEIIEEIHIWGHSKPTLLGIVNCADEKSSRRVVYYNQEGNVVRSKEPGFVFYCGDCIDHDK